MIRQMQRTDVDGGEPRGEAGVQKMRPQRTGGAPHKGKGRENRRGRLAAEQVPPSSSIPPCTPRDGRGGGNGADPRAASRRNLSKHVERPPHHPSPRPLPTSPCCSGTS